VRAQHPSRPAQVGLELLVARLVLPPLAYHQRWEHEDGFAAGKELAALDEHQVRSWTSWHRWTILALLACAFLAVLAASQPDPGRAHDDQLIPLICHEIRRLLTGLHRQPPAPRHPAALVTLATPPSIHRSRLPLPTTSPGTHITKCRWSSKRRRSPSRTSALASFRTGITVPGLRP
jgi:hypothetical protein